MQKLIILIIGFTLSLAMGKVFADGGSAATAGANKLGQAMVAKNYRGVAKLTHPMVVAGAGGIKATSKLLRDSFSGSGVTITSMIFTAPRQLIKAKDTYIAVLPYTTTAKIAGQSEPVELESFYIGFSSDQRDWRFTWPGESRIS